MEKKNKYDTNPLDQDYARRTEKAFGATDEVTARLTHEQARSNGNARDNVDAEAPTRYYSDPAQSSYPSVFIPPAYQPPAYHSAAPTAPNIQTPPTSRPIHGIGLPENVAMILPYLPFPLLGAIPGVIELALVPRNEVRVRFHAAQGLALHALLLAAGMLVRMADSIVSSTMGGFFAFMLGLASFLLTAGATVFFFISMWRVWKGEAHHIAPLSEATRWLNEKIEPRK